MSDALDNPLCALCGREAVRCPHHWTFTLPRGERRAAQGQLAAMRRRFETERARAERLVTEGRLSRSVFVELGFEL